MLLLEDQKIAACGSSYRRASGLIGAEYRQMLAQS